jgi:hypothetical protein
MFNQDYFVHAIFPGLYNEKTRISRKKDFQVFSVHIDNSMCHNGHKVSEKLAERSIERAPHPLYSLDLSLRGFWLFRMLTHNMKDREFQGQQAILKAIARSWAGLTFADVQNVFQKWMESLIWVVENNGEHCPK